MIFDLFKVSVSEEHFTCFGFFFLNHFNKRFEATALQLYCGALFELLFKMRKRHSVLRFKLKNVNIVPYNTILLHTCLIIL